MISNNLHTHPLHYTPRGERPKLTGRAERGVGGGCFGRGSKPARFLKRLHVGSWRIGYCWIARAGSYPGRIRDPFNSAPLRRYDAAGGGDDSIELNRGTRFCGLWEIIFFKDFGHSLARGNISGERLLPSYFKFRCEIYVLSIEGNLIFSCNCFGVYKYIAFVF